MAQVRLSEVNKVYQGRGQEVHAVRDLDLVVDDGEFVSIVGPSGCGKSTTLRMIVGLEKATSGQILFDGDMVNDLDPQQRNVAMAFENYALYPNFSAEENIGFPLEARGIPKQERRRRVHELAGLLQIENILHQHPNTLSGGQKQRVSLARALIREPAAFILDEVLGHVDGHLRFQMLFDLKRLHQSLDSTMIFVTHDQMEAIALSDRIAVLHQGRLVQSGYARRTLRHARDPVRRRLHRRAADQLLRRPIRRGRRGRNAARGRSRTASDDRIRSPSALSRRPSAMSVGIRPQNLLCTPREGTISFDGPRSTSMNIWGSVPSSPCAGAGSDSRPWRRQRARGSLARQSLSTTAPKTSWCLTRSRKLSSPESLAGKESFIFIALRVYG